MKTKGATQIGFVLSFVIFIMFIIFMFSAIEPFLKTQASKQSLLDFFRFTLIEEFREDLSILTINIKTDLLPPGQKKPDSCIDINRGTLADLADKNNLIIKDNSGNIFKYEFKGGNSMWIGPDLDLTKDILLKIYYAGGLGNSQGDPGNGCVPISDVYIERGSLVEEQSQVLESNIFSLKEKYELDCGETIKTELGIPEGNEFTFSFKLADETKISPDIDNKCGGIPNTNVYATTLPLQYLDSDANLQIGFLTIKVW